MLLRVPIVFAMGVAGGLALLTSGIPLTLLIQRMFAQVDSFALLAIPFFVLTGSVMEAGGISTRLVRFANSLVGRYRGGLGAVCVTTTTVFSGISGSSASDAAAVGSILIPAMVRRGYHRAYAAALQAAAAVNGPIIPPSVLMVVYAAIANVSVGAMFVGGAVPGLLVAAALLVGNWWWSRRKGYPAERPASAREIARAFVDAIWALIVPVIIIGGILTGVFTATEAGAVAAVYSLFVAMLIYRELKPRDLHKVVLGAVMTTAQVMIIIGAAGIFGWLLAAQGFPTMAVNAMTSFTQSPTVAILLIILVLLAIGCVMEILAAAIVLIPVLFPLATQYGFHEVHFAVVMVIAMALGSVTPPVGVTLYICLGIANSSIIEVNRYIWFFVAIICAVLMLVTLVPETVLALPRAFSLI
jgi:C4-dicarboxylate transporter DctM subunit